MRSIFCDIYQQIYSIFRDRIANFLLYLLQIFIKHDGFFQPQKIDREFAYVEPMGKIQNSRGYGDI